MNGFMKCVIKALLPTLPFLLLANSLSAGEMRTWTDNQGRKVEAELVSSSETNLVMKLANGKEVDFLIGRLSPEDQEYLKANREPSKGNTTNAKPELNFDAPWPERVSFKDDPNVSIIEEIPETKRFIYESANFRYVCDVRLAQSVVQGFARLFETTNLYCLSLPLGFSGGVKTKGKYQILLFEKIEDYVKEGGPPDSAGVFMSGRDLIMVPLTSLGVRPVGSSYMLDRDKSSKTLPHEIVHQLTPEPYFEAGSVGWFSEGVAEYVALSPYRSGSYNVRSNFASIFEYVTAFSKEYRTGRNLGTTINLPPIEKFFTQGYSSFLSNAPLNYGAGALITYYFFHFDGNGDAKRIKAFLKALQDGKKEKEALDVLLDGRTFKQLEEEIKKAWSRKGVDFYFSAG